MSSFLLGWGVHLCRDAGLTSVTGAVKGFRYGSSSAQLLFAADLPVSITRICRADVRPPWKRGSTSANAECNLLGVAPNGSLWLLGVIPEATWRLLRFVQNMCMRNRELCPYSGRRNHEILHIEPLMHDASDFHVDGDILARLADRADADQILQQMLEAEPQQQTPPGGPATDFNTAARRIERFGEIVNRATQEDTEDTEDVSLHTWLRCCSQGNPFLTNLLQGPDSDANDTTAVGQALKIIRMLIESPY